MENRSFQQDCRKYIGIEPGLHLANREYISIDKKIMAIKRDVVEFIAISLVNLMLDVSPTFKYLYANFFLCGSVYDRLKITKPDEFDIDILMRFPAFLGAELRENNIPGYVNLQLRHFEKLSLKNPEVYKEMKAFVDDKNYLLTKEMKDSFMQSVVDKALNEIPNRKIKVGHYYFKIQRVQGLGPAFTLTIVGWKFEVSVDFVPCILLNKSHWPGGGFKRNPYFEPSDFFLVPKSPKRDIPHIERYWRLSFQKQESKVICNCQWLKPTIRVLKRVRDKFGQQVSSYAIKTMFLNVYRKENPHFLDEVPKLWLAPFSYCVIYMLKIYAACLSRGEITYFWNDNLNLIEDLNPQQKAQYCKQINDMLEDLEAHLTPETILKYLR